MDEALLGSCMSQAIASVQGARVVAIPLLVDLSCPLCGSSFQTQDMGDSCGMARARFAIEVEELGLDERGLPGAEGGSQVCLLLAANPGEPPRPLARAASGGELSRIMLALQRPLAASSGAALLVFDEIDQNIGGRLGTIVGEELRALAEARQVLVISHLPQVAAHAETHLLAEKSVRGERAFTSFRALTGAARLAELAAMSRGAEVTELALSEAREMFDGAHGGGSEP